VDAAERRQVIVQAREMRLRAQRTCAETQRMMALAESIIRDLPGGRFVVTWATPEATVPATIAAMIRKKLDAGTLPLNSPAKLWAGLGSGRLCVACEQPIQSSQAEYELEYDDDRAVPRFQAACHGLWEEERLRNPTYCHTRSKVDYAVPSGCGCNFALSSTKST
jgi:hypothetical protein